MSKGKILLMGFMGSIICLWPIRIFAQDDGQKVFQFGKVKNLFQERDPLKENLDKAKVLQENFEAKQQGVDDDTAKILRSLKNPFIPQLPVAQPVENTPTMPINTRISTPSPEGTEEAIPTPQVTLSGLVWNSTRPQAIMNGRVVNIGDKIDVWTIRNISKQGVELTFEGTDFLVEPVKLIPNQKMQQQQ